MYRLAKKRADTNSLTHSLLRVTGYGGRALHVDRSSAIAHASAAVSPVFRTIWLIQTSRLKRERDFLRQTMMRLTFCYSQTSWTTELWSVTLNGHAWVNIVYGAFIYWTRWIGTCNRNWFVSLPLPLYRRPTSYAVRSAITAAAELLVFFVGGRQVSCLNICHQFHAYRRTARRR